MAAPTANAEKWDAQESIRADPLSDGSSSQDHETVPKRRRMSDESSAPSKEILFAAGIGIKDDDPNLPCLTIRMWVIGIGFCLLGSGLNTLYTFRLPSVTLSQSAVQFLAFPLGKLWEHTLPDVGFNCFGSRISLNPGPFNAKENILIYILANLSFLTRLSADVLTEQRFFFGVKAGWGFELAITFATTIFGFALSGIFRALVIDPPGFVWPGVLSDTALNYALHARDNDSTKETKWTMSRYRFFIIAFCISFVWYWFPDFIFPALSSFAFICWAAPNNVVVNQVFGMSSGMGLLPVTFDWAQISYIGSPLVVPTWTILNVLASLVFWIWIVSPAIYYTNTWKSAYLPFQSNKIFDNTGKAYNVSKVIDKSDGFAFNVTKYEHYSEPYLPVVYALNTFGLCFATLTSIFVWLFLEKRKVIMNIVAASWTGIPWLKRFNKFALRNPQPNYAGTPTWWYSAAGLVAMALGIFACEYYPVQLRWYGAIFAFFISFIFFLPLAWVYATANIKIQTEILCRIIAGFLWEGKVLANIWFFDLGYISSIKGLAFAQDLKLGIYCGIPPRKLFIAQAVGILFGTLSQVAVVNWALNHIPNICTKKAPNGFTCPFSQTHFNTSLIWGAVGPRRFFASGALYQPLLWFFLVGAVLPVIVYFARRRFFFGSRWLSKVHIPVFLGGLNYIPPASGMNYASWAIVGLVAGLWVKRRQREWWTRYNFILSSALDCSVAICGIVIFFAIFYTGAAAKFSWWGTTVNSVSWISSLALDLNGDVR
ncbi:OPT family small oligopeptide transporter [Aaosphaeria arxii CBS 175.79]|uniref:OPT family small oligopeptide transporter n=1 Tax=Aaosphaeria arxii CBS 175.79 TaxID=1450172 RepID=A0A6A5XF16_9PLEO|nr:OPT family small oligopeptide transporter [Aaosphaeria arxii CBS 175.79]KAF2010984.1 OPT family small oligopeptide transporter [Aaosphaeria arxii CBS 175.79]